MTEETFIAFPDVQGRITIPKRIREKLKITPANSVLVTVKKEWVK